jgi:hypothetical protein
MGELIKKIKNQVPANQFFVYGKNGGLSLSPFKHYSLSNKSTQRIGKSGIILYKFSHKLVNPKKVLTSAIFWRAQNSMIA